jgi:hypothetical protein
MLIHPFKNKKDKINMTTRKQASELAQFIVADFVTNKTTFNILGTTDSFCGRIVKKA